MKDKELVLEINGREYSVVINEFSAHEATVSVDGKKYQVGLKDLGAEQITKIKPHAPTAKPVVKKSTKTASVHRPTSLSASNTISAPLPGQIIDIFVAEGDSIEIGQKVCMLEAMKMENEVNATAAGVIVDIRFKIGATVNQGDPLFILKPAEN